MARDSRGAGWGEGDEPKGRPAMLGKGCSVLGSTGGRRLQSWEKATGSCKDAPEHPTVQPGVSSPPPACTPGVQHCGMLPPCSGNGEKVL